MIIIAHKIMKFSLPILSFESKHKKEKYLIDSEAIFNAINKKKYASRKLFAQLRLLLSCNF
jgi:hypothetical protein